MTTSRRDFLRNLSLAGIAVGSSSASGAAGTVDLGSAASTDTIYLDRNENPYGPSPKVLEAIAGAAQKINEYPREQAAAQLVERIAQVHHLDPAQIILGDGSSEILRAACAAFLGKGKRLIQPAPTYADFEAYAAATGAEVVSVTFNKTGGYDFDGMLKHPGGGLVYLCNPNNPTGTINPYDHIQHFLSKLPASYKVVVDEAYFEYSPPSGSTPSFLTRPLDDRTIVTRTFSLAYGLAGLRVGFGVAGPALVAQMRPFLSKNSVNSIALSAATAAIDDFDGLTQAVRRNADARQEFFNECYARLIKPLDSHTNFYAFNIFNPANLVIRYFRENNVRIAPVSLSWDSYLRVSFGLPEQMRTFWSLWDKAPIDKSAIRH
jgi:histidinol-phosphate aminotransferase